MSFNRMLGKFIEYCEDSLTASVFTHLLHLPSEIFWQILRDACYSDTLPANAGEPEDPEFWPKWNPSGTKNVRYVEPDVFIRFPEFDLIVEAKRWEDGTQKRDQWEDQFTGYLNEYGDQRKPVRILAIGGLHREDEEEILANRAQSLSAGTQSNQNGKHPVACLVHKCRWGRILDRCLRSHRDWKRLDNPSSQTLANARTLTDLIALFACHGFSIGRWFADFDFARHHLSNDGAEHHRIFRQRSQQLITS